MQNEKDKCPQCGQYKFFSAKLVDGLVASLLFALSPFGLIVPFIGIAIAVLGEIAALVFFLGIFFDRGRICTNCKFRDKNV